MASIHRKPDAQDGPRWRVVWRENGRWEEVIYPSEEKALLLKELLERRFHPDPPRKWTERFCVASAIDPNEVTYDPSESIPELVARASRKAFDPRGYFVYLLFGKDKTMPIYIGQSTNVLARTGQHLRADDRRHLIERVAVIRCAGKYEMDVVERELIDFYQPALNVAGVTRELVEVVDG